MVPALAASLVAAGGAAAAPQPGASVTAGVNPNPNFSYGSLTDVGSRVLTPAGSPAATGPVTFLICVVGVDPCTQGGQSLGSAPLQSSFSPPLADLVFGVPTPGRYCIRADYQGDGNWLPASSDGTACFTAIKSDTVIFGQPLGGNDFAIERSAAIDGVDAEGGPAGQPPSGSVTFSLCGPLASPTGCPAGSGGPFGAPVALSATGGFSSTATSTSATMTLAGYYCFRADYPGDSNYNAASDGSTGQCFRARWQTTATSVPDASTITLGGSITPATQVSSTNGTHASAGSPGGTVNVFMCGPLGSATGCAAGGSPLGGSSLTAQTATQSLTSPQTFTPTGTGTWCYRSEYAGDATYFTSTDGSSQGCFTVTKAATTAASTPQDGSIALGGSTSDTGTVTGVQAGGDPTGSVSFNVCGPVNGPDACTSGGASLGATQALSSGQASSQAFTPPQLGRYCYRVSYPGDGNYNASDDTANPKCFDVTKASSSTSGTVHDSSFPLGGSTTDAATVTGNNVGGTPTGTVSFSVCGPLTGGASGCTTGGSPVGSGPQQLTAGHATSPSITPDAPGQYCFRADYTGDTNYTPSSNSSSPGQCFSVAKAQASISAAPAAPTATLAGSDADHATVAGNAIGGTPTGTVSFSVCGPLTTAAGCATGGHSLGAAVAVKADGTAASPRFTPTAPGTWCFRADYSGDNNYLAANDGTSCFTTPKPNAPAVTIESPQPGAVYTIGDSATLTYACAEADGGPGIASCAGTVSNGSAIDTSTLGPHTLTVTATSKDGQTSSSTVSYQVIRPSNQFTVTNVQGHPNGHVTLTVQVPGPGAVDVLVTDWLNNLAHAADVGLLPPAPHRFVWARAHLDAPSAGTYTLNIAPNAHAKRVLAAPRYKIRVRVWVTFTPPNGVQGKTGFYGVPITPGAGHTRTTPGP